MDIEKTPDGNFVATGTSRTFHFDESGIRDVSVEQYRREMTPDDVRDLYKTVQHSNTRPDRDALMRLETIIAGMDFHDNGISMTEKPAPAAPARTARPGQGMGGM